MPLRGLALDLVGRAGPQQLTGPAPATSQGPVTGLSNAWDQNGGYYPDPIFTASLERGYSSKQEAKTAAKAAKQRAKHLKEGVNGVTHESKQAAKKRAKYYKQLAKHGNWNRYVAPTAGGKDKGPVTLVPPTREIPNDPNDPRSSDGRGGELDTRTDDGVQLIPEIDYTGTEEEVIDDINLADSIMEDNLEFTSGLISNMPKDLVEANKARTIEESVLEAKKRQAAWEFAKYRQVNWTPGRKSRKAPVTNVDRGFAIPNLSAYFNSLTGNNRSPVTNGGAFRIPSSVGLQLR